MSLVRQGARLAVASWALTYGFCVALFAACGADTNGEGANAAAVCAVGQLSGCSCPDGSAPQAQVGCATAPTGASGASAPAAKSGASAGSAGSQAAAGVAATAVGAKAGNSAGAAAESAAAGSIAMSASSAGALAAAAGGSAGAAAGTAGRGAAAGSTAMSAAGAPAADGGASTSVCAGGVVGKASNGGGVSGRGNGNVQFMVGADNQILRMRTTLAVPGKPNGNTTLFLWPGLEPVQGSPHYSPIGTGVLQPVLTWGGSCAPGSIQTRQGSNWWISSQYVNTLGNEPDHKGCYGGDTMNVESGDLLDIDMVLKGTIWTQTVTSRMTGKSVDFDMDLEMQEQRWALFEIEMPTNTKPAEDVVFTNTVMDFAKAEPGACKGSARGSDDYFSGPVASTDGMHCCVDRIVLRLSGAKPTTMDPAPP